MHFLRNTVAMCLLTLPILPSLAMAAVPDPSTVYVEALTYGGSGCPQGTVGQSVSDDRQTFTLIFDNYVATLGPGIPVSENRKDCVLDLQVHSPAGWQYSVIDLDRRGYAQLDGGVRGTVASTVFVDQQTASTSSESQFVGPQSKDYLAHDSFQPSSWSTCGTGAQTSLLTLITEVRLAGGAPGSTGQLTSDSIDGKFTTTLGLAWQPCVPPGPGGGSAPDPTGAYLASFSYGGTGCPQGSVGQSITRDRTGVELVFDSDVASSGSGIPVTEGRKACQVNLNVHIPAGCTGVSVTSDARGYSQLQSGGTATVTDTVSFADSGQSFVASSDFTGPDAEDFLVHGVTPPVTYNNALPGVVSITVQTQSTLSPSGQSGLNTLDTLDLSVSTIGCLVCPADQVLECNAPGGAVDNFPTPPGAMCSPASGSIVPLGSTTGMCGSGGATCSFNVVVKDTQPPAVTTHTVDLPVDDCDNHHACSAPDDAFKLSDCAAASDACAGPIDVNRAGVITRIEWWPLADLGCAGKGKPAPHPGDLASARHAFDEHGCPRFAALGGSAADLPVHTLADGAGSYYVVYFTVSDPSGNQTSSSCKVNLVSESCHSHPGDHADHGDSDDHGEHCTPQVAPLGCGICTGTGCASDCPAPAAACHSVARCNQLRDRCALHPRDCAEYQKSCINPCG